MHKKVKKKIVAPIAILLLVGIIAVANHFSKNTVIGEMEAVIVPQGSEVQGKIIEMKVEIGQHVEAGQVIAVIDSAAQAYAVERLELSLQQAMLKKSSSVTNSDNALISAQSAYNSAALSAKTAADDYATKQELFNQNAVSERELKEARLAASSAEKSLATAKAALNDANALFAKENSDINIRMIQVQLQEARDSLEKCTVKASCDGTIITRSYTAGNIVSLGYTIAEIAKDDEQYLVAYIPERKIKNLDYGSIVNVKYNGKSYDGKIIYMDVKTQYAPRDMQTQANREKRNFKVKLELPEACPIIPGQTAKVEL